MLAVNVAGYLSGPCQLQSEDEAVVDLLKGDPPRLELEHSQEVDSVLLAATGPLVPFRYASCPLANAQADACGSGELNFGGVDGHALDSRQSLGELCERESLGPGAMWVRAINAERKARAQSGFLRPWALTYFGAVPQGARTQWFVPLYDWWADFEVPRLMLVPLPSVVTYLARQLVRYDLRLSGHTPHPLGSEYRCSVADQHHHAPGDVASLARGHALHDEHRSRSIRPRRGVLFGASHRLGGALRLLRLA